MKQLLLHPLVLTLFLGVALVYFVIVFQLISANKKWAETVERVFIILSMLIISGMTIGITGRFHPNALYQHDITLPYRIMAIGFYAPFFILLFPRLRSTLQNSDYIVSLLLKKSIFFCIYIFIIFLSSLISETPAYNLKASSILLLVTICFIYVGKQYKMKEIFNLLLWYHTVVLLLSLVYGTGAGPWHGIYLHKNIFGATMDLTVILMYLQSVRMPKYKWLFLGLAALAVFCVFQSQGGMARVLLVVLISLLGFLRFIRRLPPRLAFGSMGIFLAIGISLVIMITENAEYIIVEKLGKDMTLTGRTYVWYRVVDAINRRPWFGYGFEGFWQPWRGLDNPAIHLVVTEANNFRPEHSHNGYLEIALKTGWLGLGIFILSLLIGIYYGVLYLTRSKEPESLLPLTIFTWIVMLSLTDGGIENLSIHWILYVLMTVRLTMETVGNFGNHPQLQKSFELESRSPFNRTSTRDSR
jgi:O-antigen ligase